MAPGLPEKLEPPPQVHSGPDEIQATPGRIGSYTIDFLVAPTQNTTTEGGFRSLSDSVGVAHIVGVARSAPMGKKLGFNRKTKHIDRYFDGCDPPHNNV
jgi:hypothetical protein